jgi:hypothetical protein
MLRSDLDFFELSQEFQRNKPFPHVVIDNFFNDDTARFLASEFPSFNSSVWHEYNNAIEVKRVCNHWDRFPETTYKVMDYLNSYEFLINLEDLLGTGEELYADPGLHGGGWHTHKRGGKLNCHLDYSIHPKLGKERRLNVIVYLTPRWQPSWGGALGLWSGDGEKPDQLVKQVDCLFNRCVIFDTSQNSWHGLPAPIQCPDEISRNSIATYYLCEPRKNAPPRGRAKFVPSEDQVNDAAVLELIEKRSREGGVFTSVM